MAYTKDKNLINYIGRKYKFTLNLADGSLTTNHPNGIKFVQQIASLRDCDLAKLVNIVVHANGPINPFIETIMVAAPKLYNIILRTDGLFIININELIATAQQHWKTVLKLENSTDEYPYEPSKYITCNDYHFGEDEDIGCLEANDTIKAASANLNELERKWYKFYENIPFVKKFAGQLEIYEDLLDNSYCSDIIHWYNQYEVDITPYLTNKNLLQTFKELEINRNNIKNKQLADGLIAMYEKYKSLEGIDADGWSYQILHTYEQFKQEAEQMHNCLIRCGYNEKMAKGVCVIVVAITPDGKRIDVELRLNQYSNTMHIVQAYYKHNTCLTEEHTIHLRNWADGLHF